MTAEKLLSVLRDATKEIAEGERRAAIAFSGGLDSSIVAAVSSEIASIRCYTAAVSGSLDAREAARIAEGEGFELEMLLLTADDIVEYARKAAAALSTEDPTQVAYTIPVLCVADRCFERLVLAGSGADELFAGYAKYEAQPDPMQSMDRDLSKMMEEARRLAAAIAPKRLGLPFASQKVVSFARSVPLEVKLGAAGRKLVLREVARLLGQETHDRPKKAAQYSSGVLKEMRRLARREGMDLTTWTRQVAASRRIIP